jgi:valyl-tRNA synthetase
MPHRTKALQERLGNEQFVARAPEDVLEKERERERDLTEKLKSYRENLELFT